MTKANMPIDNDEVRPLTKQEIDDAQTKALAEAKANAPGKPKPAAAAKPKPAESIAPAADNQPVKPKQLTREQKLAKIREESLARVDYDRFNDEVEDRFYVPPEYIPDGFTVEWKNSHVNGQAVDPSYNLNLELAGWRPVTTDLMPHIVPAGYDRTFIERDGMVLMIRPVEITQIAREADLRRAQEQMKAKMAQLSESKSGQFSREVTSIKSEMVANPKRISVEE